MERLTSSQIEDFNNPLAFARTRPNRVGQNVIEPISSSGPIRTENIEESFRLVTGASTRLETLEGNLNSMLDLAREGSRTRFNENKIREIYGKLRSLSAGFDQVVDAVQFKERTVFDGNKALLDLGPGSRPIELDLPDLHTYGDKSLDLSESSASAEISIRYRTEDLIVNQGYDIIGLNIESASFIRGSNSALELEDGNYKVNITYLGENSSVSISSIEGGTLETQTGVDLSGSGREWVDFDLGVRLTFEKESLFQSFDKYDFESKGPAYLNASMQYRRIDTHTLRTGDLPGPDSVKMLFQPSVSDSGGSLRVKDPVIAPAAVNQSPLENGNYTLSVDYYGENSIVKLTDAFGRINGFAFDVDLSGSGDVDVDLGNGLAFTVNADGFSSKGTSVLAPIQYYRETPAIDNFDFRDYARKIEEAIGIVAEQRTLIDQTLTDIEDANRVRNSANTSGIPSVFALNNTGALNILGGGSNSFFKPASATARFNTLSTQIFSTTTALPTVANQTPEQLASLQNTGLSAGWLGAFA